VEFAAAAFTDGFFNATSMLETAERRHCSATLRGDEAAVSMFPTFDAVSHAVHAAATDWVRAAGQGTGVDDSVHAFIGQRLHALVAR
jgi:hypothetical protein